MTRLCCRFAVLLVGLGWISQAAAQIQLPTLEEAVEISQKSGRPILAMAGRKT